MEILRAGEMGFSPDVRRAVEMLREAVQEGRVESLGEMILNPHMGERLARMGVVVRNGLEELQGSRVAIPVHGVAPSVLGALKARGVQIIDATSPAVRAAQRAACRLAGAGFFVVVYGDPQHPEVRGVLGWAKGKAIAAQDASCIPALFPRVTYLALLSQTTQPPARFARFVQDVMDVALARALELRVVNTISEATVLQQRAAVELACKVDAMVVVGGYNSASTRRLAELCADVVETHLVERPEDIAPMWLHGRERVGVTAGASTPDDVIEAAIARLDALDRELTAVPVGAGGL